MKGRRRSRTDRESRRLYGASDCISDLEGRKREDAIGALAAMGLDVSSLRQALGPCAEASDEASQHVASRDRHQTREADGLRDDGQDFVEEGSSTLRACFERISPLPVAQRPAAVASAQLSDLEKARLSAMLRADLEQGSLLDRPVEEVLASCRPEGDEAASLIGSEIGGFRIESLLGKGGSSTVFRAVRELEGGIQAVALKVLDRALFSTSTRRRFRRELSILTKLTHANVAHLVDAGLTEDGIPYIAMELVDGLDIVSYARDNALNVMQRLALVQSLCDAVESAHRLLVVHRDLKPGNVLVNRSGQVKVLDFGVAELLGEAEESLASEIAITPGFSAPEQYLVGPATTSVDVYAIGVIASELLVGSRLGPDAKIPAADDSASIRDSWSALGDELQAILRMALAITPASRYPSAGAFAEDVARFRSMEPLRAMSRSRWYRGRKFLERHRAASIVAALASVAVIATLDTALWQAHQARAEAARANTVRDFMVSVFDSASAHLPREQRLTAEQVVEESIRRLSDATDIDNRSRGSLLLSLAEVELSLSNFIRAEHLCREALALAEDRQGLDAINVVLADVLQHAGRNLDAKETLAPTLDRLRAAPASSLPRALAVLAAADAMLGDVEGAIAARREAVVAAVGIFGPDSAAALVRQMQLGGTLAENLRHDEAIPLLESTLRRWHALALPEDDRLVTALSDLAVALDSRGDQPATEAKFRQLLALKRRIFTPPSDSLAVTLRDLAQVVARGGATAEALSLIEEALTMQHLIYGDAHREIAATLDVKGYMLTIQGKHDEAKTSYLAALRACEGSQTREDVCARVHHNVGMLHFRLGELDAAATEIEQAIAERRSLFGPEHPTIAFGLAALARVELARHRADSAWRLSSQAMAMLDRLGQGASIDAAQDRHSFALILRANGQPRLALEEIERALADWTRVSPEGRVRTVGMLALKARLLRDLGQEDDSRAAVAQALALKVETPSLSVATRAMLTELGASGMSAVDASTTPRP